MKMLYFGRFVPDRCGADLIFDIGPLLQDEKPVASIHFRSIGSAFHGWIEYVPEFQLLITDANEFLRSVILPYIRISGLFAVANFDIDIVEAFSEDGKQVAEFGALGAGYDPIRLAPNPGIWGTIFNALNTRYGPFFRIALNDYSSATTDKELCPFHCFRAIEAMRQVVQVKHQIEDRKAGWAKLREVLKIDESEIREIEVYATEIRHGKHADADLARRTRFLDLSRRIIFEAAAVAADGVVAGMPAPLLLAPNASGSGTNRPSPSS